MENFNYEKSWFTFCSPGWDALPKNLKTLHSDLIKKVEDLQQDCNTMIPLNDGVEQLTKHIKTEDLAVLSRLSYFLGYWRPGHTTPPFATAKGESWKVSNVLDQILRARLNSPGNIEIHEGKFRVTFSSKHCWLWQEFSLATEQNLETFKTCNLSFGEKTLKNSAIKLAAKIGDLWGGAEDTPEYINFLTAKNHRAIKEIEHKLTLKMVDLEKNITEAKQEATVFNALITAGVDPDILLHNLIYYNHTKTFTFGWREPLTTSQRDTITKQIKGMPYTFTIKEA